MYFISILIISFMLASWLYGTISGGIDAARTRDPKQWVKILGFALMAIGATGFFGSGISACGGLNWLPLSFEWPVGSANGVIEMPGHQFVVPVKAPERIQVYDSNWKFLRGWHLNATGGEFKLKSIGTNQLEAFTQREHELLVFDLDGTFVSSGYPPKENYESFPSGENRSVPTSWYLWSFEGPSNSWLTVIIGMVIVISTKRSAKET